MKKFIKILIAIGVLIILIGGGFFAWKYWLVSRGGESSGGIPADWWVYDGSKDNIRKMGFSIMRPRDWEVIARDPGHVIEEEVQKGSFTGKSVTLQRLTEKGFGVDGPELQFIEGNTVYSSEKEKFLTRDEIIESIRQSLNKWSVKNNKKFEEKKILLDNQPAVMFTYLDYDESFGKETTTDIKKVYIYGENTAITIRFWLWNYDESKEAEYVPILNKILSTFRFIEIKDETQEWKTYRNEEYSFEVKYPSQWEYKIETLRQATLRISFKPKNKTFSYQKEEIWPIDIDIESLFPFDTKSYIGDEQIGIGEQLGYKSNRGYLGAVQITTHTSWTDPEVYPLTFTDYSNTVLVPDQTEKNEIGRIFEQMLSTFKFLK